MHAVNRHSLLRSLLCCLPLPPPLTPLPPPAPFNHADGDSVDFDSLMSQLVEVVLALVGNTRWQGLLRAQLHQLLHLTLGYMQMTAAQVGVEGWWLGGLGGARVCARVGQACKVHNRMPRCTRWLSQVERWDADPNQYVADEDDDFSTVRWGLTLPWAGAGAGLGCAVRRLGCAS